LRSNCAEGKKGSGGKKHIIWRGIRANEPEGNVFEKKISQTIEDFDSRCRKILKEKTDNLQKVTKKQ